MRRLLAVALGLGITQCAIVDGAGDADGSSDDGGSSPASTATTAEESESESEPESESGPDSSTGSESESSSSSETGPGSESTTGASATTPFFRSDCSQPDCGFPQSWGQYEGVLYDTTYVPGGCPDGTDSARIEYRPGPFDPGITQHPIGFGLQGIATEAVQGMELYIRWRTRVTNMFPGGQNALGWGGKFIMIGDPGPENSRLIANMRDNGTTAESTAYEWQRNIDGAEHGTGLHEVPVGEWVAGQLWVRTSSTAESEDAQLKMWLDEDNASENTPTGVSPETFAIDVSFWEGNNTRFGGFVALDSPVWSPPPVIEMCAFEIDDEFDPHWNDANGA